MENNKVFKRKNILVLGGAGFIGSHLCDRLIKQYNVICVDNFVTSNSENISHLLRNPNFVFIKHNVNEKLNLLEVQELERFNLKVAGIQYIYNLACPTSPKNFEDLKIETAKTNAVGTHNALELAVQYKARFLQASSSVVYGGAEEGGYIFKETDVGAVDQTGPRACYDEGKRFAETMCLTYQEKQNLDVKIARIFRTYGTRMPLNDGQMIPDFITNALDNKDLVIFGKEDFSSSFCYISDVVEGLIKLIDSDINTPVNIGSPDNYLIKDVAEHILGLTQSTSKIIFEKPLPFMRPLGLPDISLIRDRIGWFPIVGLPDGLKRTVEYTLAKKGVIGFVGQ